MNPTVFTTVEEVTQWSAAQWRSGKRIALVPTMGYLHRGHASLMREGARRADVVAASIFVNPTQFGPKEDLSKYPRDLPGDLKQCAEAGVSVVFAPAPAAVYPQGYQTYVSVEGVTAGLDGASRPGHFRGVATVVTKLLAMFRPHVALFGEKDFQQLQVIKALATDLNLGVEIVGMPTVRESDGLALSSRNSYLSPDERRRGLALSRGLFAAQKAAQSGERSTEQLKATVAAELAAEQVRLDYVEIVDSETLVPLQHLEANRAARALVAGFVGATRLIDNIAL